MASRLLLGARSRAEEPPLPEPSPALVGNPYLRGTKSAPDVDSVTYDPVAAFDGLNLVVSGDAAAAFLQDMKGNTLHEWRCEKQDVSPGTIEFEEWGVHDVLAPRAFLPQRRSPRRLRGLGMIKIDSALDALANVVDQAVAGDEVVREAGLVLHERASSWRRCAVHGGAVAPSPRSARPGYASGAMNG